MIIILSNETIKIILPAILTIVGSFLVAIFVAIIYKSQRKLDAEYKGREFLMQKRILSYENLMSRLSMLRILQPIPVEFNKEIVDLFSLSYIPEKKYKKGETDIEFINRIIETLYCSQFATSEDSFKKNIQALNDFYINYNIYVSSKVNDLVIRLIILLTQYYNEYVIYSSQLIKFSKKSKSYIKSCVLVLFSYSIKNTITNIISELDSAIIDEFSSTNLVVRDNYDYSKTKNQIEFIVELDKFIDQKEIETIETYLLNKFVIKEKHEEFENTKVDKKLFSVVDKVLDELYPIRKKKDMSFIDN